MKKIIIILGVLTILFFISNNNGHKQVIIPKEAIRFRVIANSNKKTDQENKQKVVTNLEKELFPMLRETNSLEGTRKTLKKNLNKFKTNIESTIKTNNISNNYTINYGLNYFPEKTYKGVTYKEGEYESLVVTLGNGLGENFWCVLFPPLCLLEAEEQEDVTNIEYSSFIKEVIDKYFS